MSAKQKYPAAEPSTSRRWSNWLNPNHDFSIQGRLIRRLLLGLACLSIVASGITYWLARTALTRQFDNAILAKAKALAALVKQERKRAGLVTEFEYEPGSMPEFERAKEPEYFQVWLPDGKTFAKSASMQSADFSPPAGHAKSDATFTNTQLPGVQQVQRSATFRFVPHIEDEPMTPELTAASPQATVTVAQSRKPLDNTLSILAAVLVGTGTLLPLLGAGLIAVTVRGALRPLEKLAEEVHAIQPASLNTTLAVSALPLEIAPVQEKLNELLQRLHEAFERERRFTSDVSHELRTPLAEARTAIEVAMRWPYDETLHAKSCTDAIDAVDHMEAMVSRLLLLARADAGKLPAEMLTEIDLGALTTQALAHRKNSDNTASPSVVYTPPTTIVPIHGDAVIFSTIIRNLIDNALAYAPPDNLVSIQIHEDAASVTWSIENAAPGLSQEDLSKMFQPFWRKDESRTGDSHAGLGLALVTSLAATVGIQVHATIDHQRLRIALQIPVHPHEKAHPGTSVSIPRSTEIPLRIHRPQQAP